MASAQAAAVSVPAAEADSAAVDVPAVALAVVPAAVAADAQAAAEPADDKYSLSVNNFHVFVIIIHRYFNFQIAFYHFILIFKRKIIKYGKYTIA